MFCVHCLVRFWESLLINKQLHCQVHVYPSLREYNERFGIMLNLNTYHQALRFPYVVRNTMSIDPWLMD